jgi:hypothetical protein
VSRPLVEPGTERFEAFFEDYECWARTKPDDFAKKYLAMWHRKSKGRAYRLIGQAYLHIAWDLPRVVEKCYPLGELERLRISEADAIDHFRERIVCLRMYSTTVRRGMTSQECLHRVAG